MITIRTLTLVTVLLCFTFTMKWGLWLMSQSSDVAVFAGPLLIVIVTSLLAYIVQLVFTHTKGHSK